MFQQSRKNLAQIEITLLFCWKRHLIVFDASEIKQEGILKKNIWQYVKRIEKNPVRMNFQTNAFFHCLDYEIMYGTHDIIAFF